MANFIKVTLAQGAFWQINKHIARCLKSANAALLLHELIDKYAYHETKGELLEREGYFCFFHTAESIEENTALTYREQKTAIKVLESFGLIKTVLMGVPAKLHFTICENKIYEMCNTSIAESAILDLRKAQYWIEQNGNTIYNNKDKNKNNNKDDNKEKSSSSFSELKDEFKSNFQNLKTDSTRKREIAPPPPPVRPAFVEANKEALRKQVAENEAYHKEQAKIQTAKREAIGAAKTIDALFTPEEFEQAVKEEYALGQTIERHNIDCIALFYEMKNAGLTQTPIKVYANKTQVLTYAPYFVNTPDKQQKLKKQTQNSTPNGIRYL